jgi:S-adenosylhomocysteine hydrolase
VTTTGRPCEFWPENGPRRAGRETLERFHVLCGVIDSLSIDEKVPFRGCDVLAVQHVHSSLVPLIDALILGGAAAERITVVSKAYSSRPPVVTALRQRGVNVVDKQRMDDPTQSYEVELAANVAVALLEMQARGTGPIAIFDEGAIASRIVASEQRKRLPKADHQLP